MTISGQKWLCGPDSTGALVVADPERLRVARPSYFSQAATSRPALRARGGRGAVRSRLALERSARGPPHRGRAAARLGLEHAAEQAALPRAARAAGRRRPGDATLVAFRHEDPPALVARLAEAGVVVREIPKTGLVRVSCGWWTSEDDLQRLAAAV